MASTKPHGGLLRLAPIVFFISAGTCWLAAAPLFGRQPGSSEQKSARQSLASESVPRVSLGEITEAPGTIVRVPWYYTPDPQTPLRSLALQIDYVSNDLKFQRAEPDLVTEKAGAEVEATLTESTPDAKGVVRSQLRLTVSLREQQPKKGLPGGLLANLVFRISAQATIVSIALNTTVLSAEDIQTPPRRVAKVNAKAGRIVVLPGEIIPQVTCFFFTH